MESQGRPRDFGHEDRRRIYDYLVAHGATDADAVQDAVLPHDAGGFAHHVAILRRNGLLAENRDGSIEAVAAVDGEAEEFSAEGVEFSIRPADQRDIAGIVGAIRQVTEEKTYTVAETVAQVIDEEDVLLAHNAVESRVFFVATVGDEVVGWVHLKHPEMEKLSHTAELTVGVIEGYRGHGIGSHLLQRGVEWAQSQGLETLYQSVPSTNEHAVEWLEGQGWTVEAVREDHYKIDDAYVDEVMLSIDL